jgi:F-type H+-transporting ATPase subunit b
MDFLKNLGIDWRLFIAQIINFGLLLWILSKFLYAPIVRQIEKNESELEEAKRLTEKLTNDRDDFAKRKKSEMTEAQKKTRKIFSDAETSAEEIRKSAFEEQKKMRQQLINQAASAAESKKDQIRDKIRKEVTGEMRSEFTEKMGKSISGEDKEILSRSFFNRILSDIDAESFLEDFPRIKKVLKSAGKSEPESGQTEPQRLRLIRENLGVFRLECAAPLNSADMRTFTALLGKKLGISPSELGFETTENPGLVIGFRLEVFGRVFEQNLYHMIQHAIQSN